MTHSAKKTDDVLDRLMGEVHHRVRQLPPGSYTTKLLQGGVSSMGGKILEEAAEVVEAAEELENKHPHAQRHAESLPTREAQAALDHLIYEACDVLYHLWVLLGSRGITVDDLRTELARREGTSGLEEKQQRGNTQP